MKRMTLLFLRRDDHILLAMKKRGFGEGKWNGVGGKAEAHETMLEAAIRECQEEIGVTPLLPRMVGRLKFFMRNDPDFLHDGHVFVTDQWEGEIQESEEMRPKWFALDNIPYGSMWPDDSIWMPYMLEGRMFAGEVVIDGDRVANHTIQPVKALERPAMRSSGSLHIEKQTILGEA